MNPARRSAAFVGLAVTILLGPVSAQGTPLASGGGAYVAQNRETHWFAFTCVRLPDGSIRGHAVFVEPATKAFLQMRITSAMPLDGMLAVAGPITHLVRTPPELALGATFFFVVDDNGAGGPVPDRLASGAAPAALGNLTIQQIIALIGPPPPAALAPLLKGNITIH